MKTNPKQAANGRNRPTNTARRAPLARGQPAASVKNRIGKPGAKPTGDLRQMLAKKVNRSSANNATGNKTSEKVSSNVKSRLGLQSKTAKLEALREAREQLKTVRDKNKPKPDVKTATAPSQTKSTVTPRRADPRAPPPRSSTASTPAARDNRGSAIASRRPTERSVFKGDYRSRNERISRSSGIKSLTTQPIIIPQIIPASQPVVYQSPAYESPGRYLSRQPEIVHSTSGHSVLVSNLSPKITEDEVAELFGDIGPLMNIQIINNTTALVTYYTQSSQQKAHRIYNFRLLDGIAMNVTILPSTSSPQASSSQQPLYSSGRMYSDSIHGGTIHSSSLQRRPNYHLSI